MASSTPAPVTRRDTRWQTAAGLSLLVLIFFACCWPFVKRLGIEVDEAIMGNGIYEHGAPWYSWHVFGYELPIMMMTYVGALKTWIINVVFSVWGPGSVSLRLPTVLIAAGTVPLFFVLLDRTVGRRAAWVGAALLATDPIFALIDAIDYGFVALESALKLGALVLLVFFYRRPSVWRLSGAFFLLGLAVWDKAVFVWVLVGLAVAGGAVFWREIRAHTSPRNVGIAAGAFVLGALPFLIYNIERPFETFRMNAHLGADNPFIKLVLLKRTLDGSGMFGSLVAVDGGPRPVAPRGLLQNAAFAVSRWFGAPTTDWMMWAVIAAIVLGPLVWRTKSRKPYLFSLVFMVVTWAEMFFATGAGGATHHVILLWPFPAMIVAAVFAELTGQLKRHGAAVLAIIAGLLCCSNLLVFNEYFVTLVRNGPSVRWTDAFPQLNAWLSGAHAQMIVVPDWGILETLNLMSQGALPVTGVGPLIQPGGTPDPAGVIPVMLAMPRVLWVTHSERCEQWPGTKAALLKTAAASGYTPELLQIIHDRNGRPIFEVLRFRRGI